MKNRISRFFTVTGLLLIAASVVLGCYSFYDEKRAEQSVNKVVQQIQFKEETVNEIPDYELDPQMDMPVEVIDGISYIGTVEIPGLDVTLPVIENWSMPNLKIAPCRYTGSVYTDNMILCSHNYPRHFGRINTLDYGSDVYFTDMNGDRFHYVIADIETLPPTAVEEMEAGDWDLTIFTCTYMGRARITVRCTKVDA